MARPVEGREDVVDNVGRAAISVMLGTLLELKTAASMLLDRHMSNGSQANNVRQLHRACRDAASTASPYLHATRVHLIPVPSVRLAHQVLTDDQTGLYGQLWRVERDVLATWGIDEPTLVASTRAAVKATGRVRGRRLNGNPISDVAALARATERISGELARSAAIGRNWKRMRRVRRHVLDLDALIILCANTLDAGAEVYRTSYSLASARIGKRR